MELSPDMIEYVIHPTAAFLHKPNVDASRFSPLAEGDDASVGWDCSQLNPKNRVDSLAPLESPLWRIDGCTSFGSQFFAIPVFFGQVPPLRLDVFIPEPSTQSRMVRDLLELDRAFHTRDRNRVASLAVSMHILRKLQAWTKQLKDPRGYMLSLPFGSRIVFKGLSLDIDHISIEVVKSHALETFLFSAADLQSTWGSQVLLPPRVDIAELHVREQLHDSTCLVSMKGRLYILKALTSFPKYLYHELKLLLTMEPHPNIMSRPVHLVTKKTTFGNKEAVIGFTLEYHPCGTMRDIVPHLASSGSLTLKEQFKWAIQIASGLLHHRTTSGTFYCDLRLDNIVLNTQRDAVMVDFEQRGVWCEFASPEVNAIEYTRILAQSEQLPGSVRQQYTHFMNHYCPGFEDLADRESYNNPPEGYNASWLALNPDEQEASEVYMLSRVLWCIFEGVSAPQRATVWASYRWESHLEFPEYQRTPPLIRGLIDRCTKGRRPTLDTQVIRRGNRLYLNGDEDNSTPQAVVQAARDWWTKEVVWASDYLELRAAMKGLGRWHSNPFDRPRLHEVVESLRSIKEELGVE